MEAIWPRRRQGECWNVSVSALPRRPFGVNAWTPSPATPHCGRGCSQAELTSERRMKDRRTYEFVLAGVFGAGTGASYVNRG